MDQVTTVIVTIIVTVLVMLSVFALYTRFSNLEKRIQKLEDAGKMRLPFRSQDEMLNALAAIDALEHEQAFKNNLLENAKAHVIKAMQVGTKREEQ